MDEMDTVLAYENKGKSTMQAEQAGGAEGRDPLMSALNNLNRVQQLEIIHGQQLSGTNIFICVKAKLIGFLIDVRFQM